MELQTLIYKPVSGQPFWFRLLTRPLERLWALVARLRAALWDKKILRPAKLPGLCLSVGNLSVGGTGKSPVVMALVSMLREKGRNPAVLTRGYGSGLRGSEFVCLKAGKVLLHQGRLPEQLPDEALMQSHRLPETPVIASPDRLGAARACFSLLDQSIDIWILDDGFQHRKIYRDYDLVLVDYHSLFGNGRYLPQGSLREKPDALRRASMVLLSRSPEAGPGENVLQEISRFCKAPCLGIPFRQGLPRNSRDGCVMEKPEGPVYLIAGIVSPERLLTGLKQSGIAPEGTYFIRDHESFSKNAHGEKVRKMSEEGTLITTEKDFNRDRKFFTSLPGSVFILPLDICLPEEELLTLMEMPLTTP